MAARQTGTPSARRSRTVVVIAAVAAVAMLVTTVLSECLRRSPQSSEKPLPAASRLSPDEQHSASMAATPSASTSASAPASASATASITTAQAVASAPEPYSWARERGYIAHAGGVVRHVALTNSREAFEESYKSGVRVFEIDFNWTSDGRLVARHDWGERLYRRFRQHPSRSIPTLEEFRRMRIRGRYHHLTVEGVMGMLRQYPDAWVMTDFKDFTGSQRDRAVKTIAWAARADQPVLDRIIVQIYEERDLKPVRRLGIENVVYTFYHLKTSMSRGVSFAEDHGIEVITMPAYLATRERVGGIRRRGMVVAAHNVNSDSEADYLFDRGVTLLYTDRLSPSGSR